MKPPALRKGDTVAVVAPASSVKREDVQAGCEALRSAGYRPIFSDLIFEQDLYFAGSVERRARELGEMFARKEVKAIVCARGGYGSNYLLQHLDVKNIREHPKIFVGYSDLTTLLTYFVDAAGLVTFHGPMAAKDWAHEGGVDLASWQAALGADQAWEVPLNPEARGLIDGRGEGTVYGGCLSLLAASLGTPYEIATEATILFIEDIAAKPFQIDRMLMQLKLAGKLKDIRGLIFGEMLDCVQTANQGYTLEEVVLRIVGGLGVPVVFGVRSGHVSSANITLPIGVRAALSVSGKQVELKILETAVLA